MTRKAIFSMVVLTVMSVLPTFAWKGDIVMNTPNTSLVMYANEGGNLRFAYYGDKLSAAEVAQVKGSNMDLNQTAYPAFGQNDMLDLPAIQVLHNDGQWTLYPTVDNVSTTTEGNATVTTVTMTDK